MADQTVTLVLDAEQYYASIAKVTKSNDALSRSGQAFGEGFLRGDRAVRVATSNIVQGLAMANNAADATLMTMMSLERVFRIPIGATIFAAAGIAGVEAIGKIVEKAQELRNQIDQIKREANFGATFLGTDQITKSLTDTTKTIGEVQKDMDALTVGNKGKFLGIDFMGSETRAGFIKADEEKLKELRGAAAQDVENLIEKQNDLNRVEQERVDGQEHLADLDKAEIDNQERLGKLAETAAAAGLKGTEQAKQLLEVESDRYNVAVRTLNVKQQLAQEKSLTTAGDFFSDLGSDRFVGNFFGSQKHDIEAGRGQARLQMAEEELARSRAKGEPDDPILAAMVATGQRLGVSAQTGLSALIHADFSNLLMLSKYDFRGLEPLNKLTIQIQ